MFRRLINFPRLCWRFVQPSSWAFREFMRRCMGRWISRPKDFRKNGFIAGRCLWAEGIERRFWRIKRPARWRGRFATGWFIPKFGPAWAGVLKFLFPVARRWVASWRSGTRILAFALTRVTG